MHSTQHTLIRDALTIYIHKVLSLNIVDLLVEIDKRNKHSERLRTAWANGKYNNTNTIYNLWRNRWGQPVSETTRKRISESRKGYKMPESTKQRISTSRKGEIHLPHKPETICKMRQSHIGLNAGDKHPNWKGGISHSPYCHKFNNRRRYNVRKFFGNKIHSAIF